MKKGGPEEKLEKLLTDFTENLTGGLANRSMEPNSEEDEVLPLLETIRTISSVIQPKQPSEEFAARVSQAARQRMLQRFQEQVSTEKIQRIIGMAVTMEDFRKSLFHDIVAACSGIGLSLTPKEIAALRSLKEDVVKEFANSLDERITKFFPANLP